MKVELSIPSGPREPGLFELAAFNVTASSGFAEWLAAEDVSLAVTMGNQLVLVGRDLEGDLRIEARPFAGVAGLATVGARTIYMSSGWQLLRLEDALSEGRLDGEGHDRLYLTQTAFTTGLIGVHDIAVPSTGVPLFTSALCNCVATISRRLNFTAVWKPPFISGLVGEDRCHVTGLALDGDELAYVTCAAESDVEGGWRDSGSGDGVVVDVRAGRVLARGLTHPHSPRLHGGKLYVAGAGDGALLEVSRDTGESEVVARMPGLARGLDFAGSFAVVGCSRVPEDGTYASAPIATLPASEQRHSLVVVDLETGAVSHEIVFEAASGEVFGVSALQGSRYGGFAESSGRGREQLSLGPAGKSSSGASPGSSG